jgi:hypothetical protein
LSDIVGYSIVIKTHGRRKWMNENDGITVTVDQLGARASRIVYGARSVSRFTGNTFPEKLDSLAAWHFHLAQ